ncbi:MAG: hypothetical protein K8U03_18635 [Planctomycetia bacterium]|nr:hypothetical protein [Planctomycetia bacterium]
MNDEARGDEPAERINPFSSRFVRPGALPFLFPSGLSAAALVERFLSANRRGQIVGPHGAGKSTLLASLVREFTARGERVQLIELHDGQRRLKLTEPLTPRTILCLDGYEQLSFLSRVQVACSVRRHDCGLLLTTHTPVCFPVRLPTLFEVCPSVATAVQLATELLARHSAAGTAGDIAPEEVERLFSNEGRNMRELFFRLYDLAELRRS